MRALIVAVDGVLADTVPQRAAALHSAARTLELTLSSPPHARWPAGLSLAEAARAALERDDETLIDLLALAAERALRQQLGATAPLLHPEAVAQCAELVSAGWRVVLRTDGARQSAGPLLEHLITATGASRACAADDVRGASSNASVVQRQYAEMARSLQGATLVHAVEYDAAAMRAARAVLPQLVADWP
jgi:phosphoglycolate phosphatase-like HAD superfamily hydrolase